MFRWSVVAIAATLMLTGAPVQGSAEEAPEGWSILITPDGPQVVPEGAVPAGETQEECEGFAPDEVHCTTQHHVASEVWAVAIGGSFTYTGTLEVRLFHATSVLVTQVHVIDGSPVGFNTYGQFPNSPAVFWHECLSYELGEAGEDPMPLPYQENGEPGGSGGWSCFVLYP